jgi:hypothetical protein
MAQQLTVLFTVAARKGKAMAKGGPLQALPVYCAPGPMNSFVGTVFATSIKD